MSNPRLATKQIVICVGPQSQEPKKWLNMAFRGSDRLKATIDEGRLTVTDESGILAEFAPGTWLFYQNGTPAPMSDETEN